jgi:probable HAF family extracellular repeat protein
MSRILITAAGAIVFAAGATNAQTVQALSSLGGEGSIAWAINNNGVIVGESLLGDNATVRATRWGAGLSPENLGVAAGATHSFAYGINDAGSIVGASELASGMNNATVWWANTLGVVTNLGAEMNASGPSVAWAISNTNVIAGQAALNPGFSKGFVWDATYGGRHAGLAGMYQGGAYYGVNDAGVVVGSGFFFGDPDDALIARPNGDGTYGDSDIAPPGYNLSIARDINNHDMVVGFTNAGMPGPWQAAIFEGRGAVTLLGTLEGLENSEAYSVNDNGLIVGSAWDDDFQQDSAAWAWLNGTMYDLNDFLGAGSDFTRLLSANGVNNNGDIVGVGVLSDGTISGFVLHGFVPAPGTVGLLGMGLAAAARRRR